jgi:endonuclease/exonuclease/phosphatase family metal-dependent hydrolase
LDVLGIRIPDFSRAPRLRRATWDWVEAAAASMLDRRAVILGDLNTDPEYPPSRCGERFEKMAAIGFTHATPKDGASYWTLEGEPKRLDHGFVSPRLRIERAAYVAQAGNHVLAGSKPSLSDHAALVIDILT